MNRVILLVLTNLRLFILIEQILFSEEKTHSQTLPRINLYIRDLAGELVRMAPVQMFQIDENTRTNHPDQFPGLGLLREEFLDHFKVVAGVLLLFQHQRFKQKLLSVETDFRFYRVEW